MRIVKDCEEGKEANSITTLSRDIPIGTIFRYGALHCGPYLKILDGFVDLRLLQAFPEPTVGFQNYTPLHDAYLVTGEERD